MSFFSFPWGLLFLVVIAVSVALRKKPLTLELLGQPLGVFLALTLALLVGFFVVLPLPVIANSYLNLGGLGLCIVVAFWVRSLNGSQLRRTFLAMTIGLAVLVTSSLGIMWPVESIVPFWGYILPFLLAALVFALADSFPGALAALAWAVVGRDFVVTLLFSSGQAVEIGGLASFESWLVMSCFCTAVLLLKEFVARKKVVHLD